jgi:hypothetical protein
MGLVPHPLHPISQAEGHAAVVRDSAALHPHPHHGFGILRPPVERRLWYVWPTTTSDCLQVLCPNLRCATSVLAAQHLSACPVHSTYGTAVLANILKANNVIEKVNLGYNRIGRHGAAALGEALAGTRALLRLVSIPRPWLIWVGARRASCPYADGGGMHRCDWVC